MLDSHPNISCGPETKILPHLDHLIDRYELAAKFARPRSYWLDLMRGFYGRLQTDYMEQRGKRRWAEKTPGYTLHLPLIEELYPDALYVHVIRDGRDVVASTRERWGYRKGLGTALFKWRRFVTVAREFGSRLPPGRYHEVRYEDVVADPEREMRTLVSFVGEPWDPAMIYYDQAVHGGHEGHLRLQEARRRTGGDQRLIYGSRIRGGAGLDPLLRFATWLAGRRLLAELGYAVGSSRLGGALSPPRDPLHGRQEKEG